MFLVPMTRNSELARSFDRLSDESFERFFAPSQAAQGSTMRSPALDVAESDTAYTVSVELPGVTKDDVKVSVEGRQVTVQASRRKRARKKKRKKATASSIASARWPATRAASPWLPTSTKARRPPSSKTAC